MLTGVFKFKITTIRNFFRNYRVTRKRRLNRDPYFHLYNSTRHISLDIFEIQKLQTFIKRFIIISLVFSSILYDVITAVRYVINVKITRLYRLRVVTRTSGKSGVHFRRRAG